MNSSDFEPINDANVILKEGNEYIVELTQKKAEECPYCHSREIYIKDHRRRKINAWINELQRMTIYLYSTRCYCINCNKSFTPAIKGFEPKNQISLYRKELIKKQLLQKLSYRQIARANNVSTTTVISIFDKEYSFVPRKTLPSIMCLDEIRFTVNEFTKYITIITNFETGEIIDILDSRKIERLKEYFGSISIGERKQVKAILSDMYEVFDTICSNYFPSAIHCIDLFHVVTQLTNAVNRIRTATMKKHESTPEAQFMKTHWRFFLCRRGKIPETKTYWNKESNKEKDYFAWINDCLNLEQNFRYAYQALQELMKYDKYSSYEDAERHMKRIISLLEAYQDDNLKHVAQTYRKWMSGIVNTLDKKSRKFRYTTGIAECINNHIKTMIKVCYGCYQFDRFRRRILLLSRYNHLDQ